MRAETVLRLISGALQDLEQDVESRWTWEAGENDSRIGLIEFLNQAVRAIVLQRPDLMAVTENILLEPGMRQSLPCRKKHHCKHDATMLIELTRNMYRGGECAGPAIMPVDPNILQAWACSRLESETVENFAYDRMTNPKVYMVYPAVPYHAEVWVEATFGIHPPLIVSADDCISLPDDYAPALVHHVLAAILSGDNDSSSYQKAIYHAQMYNSLLGIKTRVDAFWPKAKSSPVPGGSE